MSRWLGILVARLMARDTHGHVCRWHRPGGKVYKLMVKEPIYTNDAREDGSK